MITRKMRALFITFYVSVTIKLSWFSLKKKMLIKNLNIWAQYESILFLDWRVLSLGFIFAVQIYHWLALDRKIIHFRTNFLQLSELLI